MSDVQRNLSALPLGNDLAVVHRGEIVPSLDELAVTVEREHQAVSDAIRSALMHALQAGAALLAAQSALNDEPSFERWVEERGLHYRTGQKYMRLATYRDELMALPTFDDLSMTRAQLYLRGLPKRARPREEQLEAMVAEIKRLHREGRGSREIARALGCHRSTVRYHTDAKYRQHKLRRDTTNVQEARRVKKMMETEARVRARGGSTAEGYALVRRALLQLQAALEDAGTVDERVDLERAIASLFECEDWIGRAIRSDVPVARRTKVRRAKTGAAA